MKNKELLDNTKQFEERILQLRKTSTKRAGGNAFHYSALCAIGDGEGNVGVAIAKSKENVRAMTKAKDKARRSMRKFVLTKTGTIPHEISIKFGAAKILLRPAPPGSGIIAGGSIRQVLEIAGIKNISAKMIGSTSPVLNAYAIVKALSQLKEVKKKQEVS